MRQQLHSRWDTFWSRAAAVLGGVFAFAYGSIIMINAGVPFVLIVAIGLVICGLVVLGMRRFESVWLNGLNLELPSRTISLADVSRIELKGSRPTHIRVTYGKEDRVVKFIPQDHGFFSGGGEGTLQQLRRLILVARGEHQ